MNFLKRLFRPKPARPDPMIEVDAELAQEAVRLTEREQSGSETVKRGQNAPSGKLPPITHPNPVLTERMVLEILEHEAIVREAYKDSAGKLTWGVGVTNASGHTVERYRDKPAPMERVLEIYVWLLRTRYLPEVLAAFHPITLTEYERGAALSFHYNTGAIREAEWVRLFKIGKREEARAAFMNYSKPKEIIARRKAERDLFFDGKWTTDGKVVEYTRVRKPSRSPDWGSARLVDVRDALREAMRK